MSKKKRQTSPLEKCPDSFTLHWIVFFAGAQDMGVSPKTYLQLLTVERTAGILGVSAATVRNWVRCGRIVPAARRPVMLSRVDVLALKKDIRNHVVDKLRKCANKSNSRSFHTPHHSDFPAGIAKLRKAIRGKRCGVAAILFAAVSDQLCKRGELLTEEPGVFLPEDTVWNRDCVREEMLKWYAELAPSEVNEVYPLVAEVLDGMISDSLCGNLYQALSRDGTKYSKGSYYTPEDLICDSLKIAAGMNVRHFLDPCCGTGNYLCAAADILNLQPEGLFGVDIDETALHVARINLMLKFPRLEFTPHLYCADALSEFATGARNCRTNRFLGFFDFIATNPPWGTAKKSSYSRGVLKEIRSGETFSLFIVKALSLLKEGGTLSVILPESVLNIRSHADIRRILAERHTLRRIKLLGRKFSGVFTNSVRLDVVKSVPAADAVFAVESDDETRQVSCADVLSRRDCAYHVNVTERDSGLLKRIFSLPHLTLKGHARWALGIVTGDNRRYVSESPQAGYEEVFKGGDVNPFFFSEPHWFIKVPFDSYQQVAPLHLYAAPEKLVYRFISSRLIFAYDDRRRWILNSANILIPELPSYPVTLVLAFLNSTVFQYIFMKKYATHKVLRGDLEELPFPLLPAGKIAELAQMAESVVKNGQAFAGLNLEICHLFHLNANDLKYICHELEKGNARRQ